MSYTDGVRFEINAAATTSYTLTDWSPRKGKITQLTMHYPAGCNGLVNVAFFKRAQPIYPSHDYIALNDANPQFMINEPVEKDEELNVIVDNGDVFPHRIVVIVTIEGD